MVEEAKQPNNPVAARGAFTYANEIAMWAEKAPICKCGREKSIYICEDEACHKQNENKFIYCGLCLEEGVEHQHFRHQRITNAMNTFSQRWIQLKENSATLFGKASEFIEEFNPLIKYLEKLTREADGGLLARFPV